MTIIYFIIPSNFAQSLTEKLVELGPAIIVGREYAQESKSLTGLTDPAQSVPKATSFIVKLCLGKFSEITFDCLASFAFLSVGLATQNASLITVRLQYGKILLQNAKTFF